MNFEYIFVSLNNHGKVIETSYGEIEYRNFEDARYYLSHRFSIPKLKAWKPLGRAYYQESNQYMTNGNAEFLISQNYLFLAQQGGMLSGKYIASWLMHNLSSFPVDDV